jgi:hypothetical protein
MLIKSEVQLNRLFFVLFAFYFEFLTAQNRFFPAFYLKEFQLSGGASRFSTGDIDGDGMPDIAVVTGKSITCFKNDNGSLNFYTNFQLRDKPTELKVDDLDGDGWGEILTVYKSNSTVEIFKGDTIGFKRFSSVTTSVNPEIIELSDIDLNGFKDIVTTGKLMLGISVNYQIQKDDFSTPVNFFPKIPLRKIKLIDLNYDGVPDIAGIDWLNNSLIISYGRGDGKFGRMYSFQLPEEPTDFAVADINNDGFFDYAIAFFYLNEVQIYITTQSGITSRFQFKIPKPSTITLGDINGDSLKDVIIGNGEKLFVFINRISSFERYEFSAQNVSQVECCDFDLDGRDEIVMLDSSENKLLVFYHADKFTFSDDFSLVVGLNFADCVVSDLDRDGVNDLTLIGDGETFLFAFRKEKGFYFSSENIGKFFTDMKFLSFADYNYFFCTNYSTGDVSVFRLNDKKRLSEIFKYNFDKPMPVFVGVSADSSIFTFLTVSDSNLLIMKINDISSFDEFTIKELDSVKVMASAVADFNKDGYFDLAVVAKDTSNIKMSIFLRSNEGKYVRNFSTNLNRMIKRVFLFISDFNDDGFNDILAYYDYSASRASDGEINLFINDGSGKFRKRVRIDTHVYLSSAKMLKIADLNGDFKKDFALFDRTRGSVYIYINEDEKFEKFNAGGFKGKFNYLGVADLDFDGFLDLFLINSASGSVKFIINNKGQF